MIKTIHSEISLLYEIGESVIAGHDINKVFSLVLKILSDSMGMVKGMLTIYNRKSGEIFIEEAFGFTDEERARGVYQLGEGIIGKVVDSGKPIIVPKISEEPEFLDKTGSRKMLDKDKFSFLCIPIKYRNEVIGALCADKLFDEDPILEDDVKFLSIITTMISQAVRLHQIEHEELELLSKENRRLQDELKEKFKPSNIVGKSKSMRQVYALIDKISKTNTTILDGLNFSLSSSCKRRFSFESSSSSSCSI